MEHFDIIVNTFTDADDLMNFAATWGIQGSPGVRFRLFQLRNPQYGDNFVNEELESILESLGGTLQNQEDTENFNMALEYVREQEEIEGAVRALLFDEEMNEMATACVDDGEWSSQLSVMIGGGDDTQPGSSHRPDTPRQVKYTIRKKSERTYATKAAVESGRTASWTPATGCETRALPNV
jgi:hypothetical protein